MKILMFGWEFPPQISGGLGTACYGLTKALIDANVNVLFVVPKSSGKEKENFLIDASAMIPDLSPGNAGRKRSSRYRIRRQHVKKRVNQFTVLEVPSYLRPYQQPVRTLTPATVQQTTFDEQSEESVAGEDHHLPAPFTLTAPMARTSLKKLQGMPKLP